MQASLIIPYYKDIVALELILTALNNQSAKGKFEVIIAEDDNALETKIFLEKIRPLLNYPLQHVTQEDKGYQRSKALNNGIKIAQTDFIIFIDGDCIPHKHFIKEYIREKEDKKVLYGRRVNLSEGFSKKLKTSKSLRLLNFFNLLFSKSTRVKESLYIPLMPHSFKSKRALWGCNCGTLKQYLIDVNGFDEDYSEYGYEDTDLYYRLNKLGCELKSVKYQAIQYHLYHERKGAEDVMNRGEIMFEQKKKKGLFAAKTVWKNYHNA